MKYALIRQGGVIEVREDSSTELPEGGIPLTNDQYNGMCDGSLTIVNGEVVTNPNPLPAP